MSEVDVSRRNLLRNVALAASLGGLTAEAAQHVHQAVQLARPLEAVLVHERHDLHPVEVVHLLQGGRRVAGQAEVGLAARGAEVGHSSIGVVRAQVLDGEEPRGDEAGGWDEPPASLGHSLRAA